MRSNISKKLLIVLSLILVAFFTLGCGATPPEVDIPTIVGISWCEETDVDEYSEDLQAYIDAVELAGGVPKLLALIETELEAEAALDTIDAIIMTGGEDIDPSYYNEKADGKLETVNHPRDNSDYILLDRALARDLPILAICRGHQFLNVATGGTLYQDIPTQYETDILHRSLDEVDFEYHDIGIVKGSKLEGIYGAGTINVNSWHHQGIKDLGEGLYVIATSGDGMIEAIEMEGETFVVGVQFHPEWHVDDGDMAHLVLFQKLVEYGMK